MICFFTYCIHTFLYKLIALNLIISIAILHFNAWIKHRLINCSLTIRYLVVSSVSLNCQIFQKKINFEKWKYIHRIDPIVLQMLRVSRFISEETATIYFKYYQLYLSTVDFPEFKQFFLDQPLNFSFTRAKIISFINIYLGLSIVPDINTQ